MTTTRDTHTELTQRSSKGVKGFIKQDVHSRFWSKVNKTDTCWLWTAIRNQGGYGRFWIDGKQSVVAHRYAYELLVGPIPEGLTLDHLCRNRSCVNPDHLEPVTNKENTRRGLLSSLRIIKTHCANGHLLDLINTYYYPSGERACRICTNDSARRHRRLKKVKVRG